MGFRSTDPRPIGDKKYSQKCINTISSFLGAHGFDMPAKNLVTPMTKDFIITLNFLINQIDPHFKIPPGTKFDEDLVLQVLKFIQYPINLSKRNLSSIGTPHTWPSVLAALVWIVELLKVGIASMK